MTRVKERDSAAKEIAWQHTKHYDPLLSKESWCEMAAREAIDWADEHPQNPQLSAADRGIIDEIIFALNSLGKEKMISYHKEIEFLNKIRKL